MDTKRPIILYAWKDTKLNQTDPKIQLKSMDLRENDNEYNPTENARQLARLFSMSLPGNTLDLFYAVIADEILPMLESNEKVEMLKSPYDLSNRIRIAINQLSEGDN